MLKKVWQALPIQLLLIHLKKSQLLLLLWVLLFSIISKSVANKYGIPFLFLTPEYLSNVNYFAYAFLGFSIGGFVIAYNISGYILHADKFPFIATLKQPFIKYSINNAIIPISFLVYYNYSMINFHLSEEFTNPYKIATFVSSFLGGFILIVFITYFYFFRTNKNVFKILGIPDNEEQSASSLFIKSPKETPIHSWKTTYYFSSFFKIKFARSTKHYSAEMLSSVLKQNHLNASLFEITMVISFIIIGYFGKEDLFQIPASASITLLFTMLLMIFSAFYSLLKGWATLLFILILLGVNYLSSFNYFSYENKAFGLSYTEKNITNYGDFINEQNNNNSANLDYHLNILTNWQQKQESNKPKLILINASGGGSRAMFWTYTVIDHLNNSTNFKFFKQTHLISGSSGGMIGAAYYRELYLNKPKRILDENSKYNMCKDLLNPIAFSIASNDIFFRFKKFKYNKTNYTIDRGYYFEHQLNLNTNHVLDKKLNYYLKPELESKIPLLVLSPTIINDSRRLIISPHSWNFICNNKNSLNESVDYQSLFKNNMPNNLRFTSALRMSASFPYIMPSVTLPSTPKISVMDAGIRDNYGALTSLRYIHECKNWIKNNTSGVIIVQIRDSYKRKQVEKTKPKSIAESLSSPLGSLFDNMFVIQDYNIDEMTTYLQASIDFPLDIINFELDNNKNDVSLSWHLTSKEKQVVLNSIYSPNNKQATKKLKQLLNKQQ